MTRVYVDLETLAPGGAGAGRAVPGRAAAPAPAAVRSLGYLIEAGHEVILIGSMTAIPEALADAVSTVAGAAPAEPNEPAWYLTVDVERCRGRSAKLRTVLVGTAAAPAAIHRCDTLARDVQAAVLEILAAEAMPGV